ncbi:MAG: hypothetical protein ABI172_04335 [Ginsengibacter sp.]|jgi:hypothetical protein
METLTLNKTKFVLIEQKEFERIQLKAAQKTPGVKKLSINAGRKHALKLIDKWAKEK